VAMDNHVSLPLSGHGYRSPHGSSRSQAREKATSALGGRRPPRTYPAHSNHKSGHYDRTMTNGLSVPLCLAPWGPTHARATSHV
jgi:hypothetical protein